VKKTISRRDFIKILGIGTISSLIPNKKNPTFVNIGLGRVTTDTLSVHQTASDKSQILFQHLRDDILNLYEEVVSESGPAYNPLWYRIWGGYIHSAFIQKVAYRLNPVSEIPQQGALAEVTVPISQAYLLRSNGKWERFYTLFYSSTHWVFSVREGRDGQPWYEIRDGLVTLSYYVPATHLHIIEESEISPISSNVDPSLKKILISIDTQTLTAYEGSQIVKQAKVSTGLPHLNPDPSLIPTDTPRGKFRIYAKRPSVHMGDGTIRTDAEAYELPGVPWVSYFEGATGVAIHGTYWHNNFGLTMSHGCVNMHSEDAKWIYRWCTTFKDPSGVNYTTPVVVS